MENEEPGGFQVRELTMQLRRGNPRDTRLDWTSVGMKRGVWAWT